MDVALDACCMINLCAAGTIFSSDAPRSASRRRGASSHPLSLPFDFTLHLPAKVRKEVQYILQPDDEDKTKLVKSEIDLTPLVKAGFLHECDLEGNDEAELFVQLATKLDDGEATCFAIAKNRGWFLATDERLTENLAKKLGVSIITTPELVKHWADKKKVSDDDLAQALWNIQTYAHYFPRKTLSMYSWWINLVVKAKPTDS